MASNLTVANPLSSEIQNVTDANGNASGLYLGAAQTGSVLSSTICTGATTVSGVDWVDSFMPMVLAGNTNNLTFGTQNGQTMGRLLRLIDLRNNTFYDVGINQNNMLFVNNSNDVQILSLDGSGNLTIAGTLTQG